MSEYLDSLDIANRALQHCEQTQIASVTESSKNNLEASFGYGKVRRAELRRNPWRFAIRRVILRPVDVNTMILQPAQYDATVTYLPGAIVADANDVWWLSMESHNKNNTPGGNNNVWETYFGPKTIEPYDTTGGTAYETGDLVYTAGALAGSYLIYMSLQNGNADVPGTATPWSATTTYNSESVVSYIGSQWKSRIELNLNVTPADGPLPFDAGATYSSGQTVTGSDNFIYSSVGNGNVGHDPTTDGGVHWTIGVANGWYRTPAVGVSSTNWRLIQATMKILAFPYPIGAGPSSQSSTRNVYRLPAGYLKTAPQDPTAGSTSFLGGPSGLMDTDWTYEGDYIVSRDTGPLLLRFVADITRVVQMDDMFCEGLALTLALAISPSLQQSTAKMQELASEYKLRMGEARIVNAIETGPEQPPEDDWLTCRA